MYSSLRAEQQWRVRLTFAVLLLILALVVVMIEVWTGLHAWWFELLIGGPISRRCWRWTERVYGLDRP